jgi:hypothetical protein
MIVNGSEDIKIELRFIIAPDKIASRGLLQN